MSKLLIRHFLTINPFGWCGSTHLGGARYGRRRVWCALLLHFQRKGEDHGHHEQRRGAEHRREGLLAPQLPYGAASAGALAVLGLSGCAPKGKDELSDTGASATGADVNWDEETEALVVGSGYAGLAAAYEAAKAGAAVRVIEKRKMAGGNSVYADRADRRGGLGRPEGRGHRGQHRDLHERCAHRRIEPQLQGQAATCGREVQRGVRVDRKRDRRGMGPGRGHRGRGLPATSIPTPPHPPPT